MGRKMGNCPTIFIDLMREIHINKFPIYYAYFIIQTVNCITYI